MNRNRHLIFFSFPLKRLCFVIKLLKRRLLTMKNKSLLPILLLPILCGCSVKISFGEYTYKNAESYKEYTEETSVFVYDADIEGNKHSKGIRIHH